MPVGCMMERAQRHIHKVQIEIILITAILTQSIRLFLYTCRAI